jgi:hypothetical protein
MAVCNLFNELTNASGNFLMFSQYVEDLTRHDSESDNWKIVPTRFLCFDIDYSKFNPLITESDTTNVTEDEIVVDPIDDNIEMPDSFDEYINTTEEVINDLNKSIPEFLQNYLENAAAYSRNNLKDINEYIWTPENFKNIFWNTMFASNLLSVEDEYIKEMVYNGTISMQSHNRHQGMGYSEIYCYVPSNAGKKSCKAIENNVASNDFIVNENSTLEGYNIPIGNYSKEYCYHDMNTVDYDSEKEYDDSIYNFNTIVVFYSIRQKNGTEWVDNYTDIPMGMYFTGKFNGTELSNIVKHVTTDYETGTAYGLRICTRFSASSSVKLITDITTDISDNSYSNLCMLMTKMNENLSRMLNVVKSSIDTSQGYKDLASIIKNNRTNVPYIKNINGKDYWFVNGKMISNNPI